MANARWHTTFNQSWVFFFRLFQLQATKYPWNAVDPNSIVTKQGQIGS